MALHLWESCTISPKGKSSKRENPKMTERPLKIIPAKHKARTKDVIDGHLGNDDLLEINEVSRLARKQVREVMAEEDAFLVDNVEGGLCIDYTEAEIVGRCNNESDKDKGKDSLESKYMAEDSFSKKFLVSNFNNYKMVDSRPVMEQYNELLRILGQYTQHGLKLDESISVSCIIDKLPSFRKDFKRTLKHGKDDLSLVQLNSYLRIEESLRVQDNDKGNGKEVDGPSVNMTEEGKNKQNKGKKRSNENNNGSSSNKKPKLECWKCGKTGHFKRDCRNGKKNNANVGGSGKGSKDHSQDQGFGYYNNGMFMVNLNKVPDDSDSVYMSSSTVVNSLLWHACLGHVHYKRILEIYKDDLITAIDENPEKMAVVRLPDPKRKTLCEKGIDCIFVGYAEDSKAYRDDHFDDVPNETPEPRKEAINDEIGSIMENNTWVLSDLPPGCKPLGCKWIFKRKMKVDGTIDKIKARLEIQGFKQNEGIDYFNTYAPVARITTIRLLLALAAIQNLMIHQIDVKTTFLNGDLDEKVYMKQPEGFVMLGNEHKVCELVNLLYGLKQAPKQWHQNFEEVVLCSGFLLNQSDKYVYSKFDDSGKGVIICLYVDDMLIFSTDQNQVDKTKKFLSSRFSMKDIGEANVILGNKIKRENKGIVIKQSQYIKKILKKFNYEDCLRARWYNHVKDSPSTSGKGVPAWGMVPFHASRSKQCITSSIWNMSC
ncbi:zinc finger, CCHC-type containing protein [Tanacetum coccineum]